MTRPDQPYADVHVGIVALDPERRPAGDLLPDMRGEHRFSDGIVFIDGDGFTAWGEPFPDDVGEPIHAVVRIPRPVDEDGEFTDCTEHHTRPARELYADKARAGVLSLLAYFTSGGFRLADYVAVDFDPTWGEDSMVIGRWA